MNPHPDIPKRRRWSTASSVGWLAVGSLLALPWFTGPGHAAVQMFLKLDNGKIAGESMQSNHKGEIEILSMDFGGANSGTTHLPTGGGGTSSVRDLRLFKFNDRSTPVLLNRVMTGEPIGVGTLTFVESFDGKERPVVTLSFKNILVTSMNAGGSDGEDRLIEKLSLNFSEFTYQTFSYSATGVTTDSPSMTWDIVTGTGSLGGAANTAPTITAIANQATAEDTPFTTPFTIGDAETVSGSLTLARSTSNPLVVPISGITFGGTGSSRTVNITPAANASGSSTVTVTVTDPGGLTASRSFVVTVNPVNDPPAIAAVPNQITNQNETLLVGLNVSDIDTPAAAITITPTSSNPGLIPAGNITFSGSGAATVMSLKPVAGASGSAEITLTANDGALPSQPVSFTLTVNAVATGPTDIQLSAVAVAENSPQDTLIGNLTATDPDDPGSVVFSLIDSAAGRFKLGGPSLSQVLVEDGGLLDFEAATSHSITVRATDAALNTFDKAFTLTVLNVNEAPVIIVSEIPPIATESNAPITGLGLRDPDSGSADLSVVFQVDRGTLRLDDTGDLAGKVTGNGTGQVTVTAPRSDIDATLETGGLMLSTHGLEPGILPLSIRANDLGNTGSGGPMAADAVANLRLIDTPFNQWRRQKFNAAQLAALDFSGALADADKDGVANLLEYAVGSGPLDPADGPGLIEFIEVDWDGLKFPAIRFNRLKPALDPALKIRLEVATDDFDWRTNPEDFAEVSSEPFDATRDTIVLRSNNPVIEVPRQMLRLRFTLDP